MTESASIQDQPSDLLLNFILGLISPLLMAGGIGDAGLARRAAMETIAAYKAGGQDQLITITQIVGFALVSLDSLRLSMPAELSLPMKLRLRGNANALNRSAQRSTATLEKQRRDAEKPVADQPVPQAEDDTTAPAEALASLERAQTTVQQAETLNEQDRRRLWANAMTDVAAECSRDLNKLPPAQRRAEIIRIGALSATARQLNQENVSGPSDLGQHALQN